ncbi:hypothetical protein WOLCODRAFT_132848 [Wolfiporia cocos MD-104 SS10]|uniref:Uncharacterized protein n=1 Tax=Wolfiporia cocos (strain MD-104) TaxID=742152 RepID=A0A2H3K3I4_WOLCO|nr:hypothetical protein WOLCODRAFT_132848 [Wolfiporia cocos MD-104 SS10]
MSPSAHLQPLPPSPDEEDISRAGAWADLSAGSSSGSLSKGKEKEYDQETLHDYRGGEGEEEETLTGADGYPPTKEEEAESRRIEENLRRWETAERERRKAARASAASGSGSNSVVGDITRKASLLWPSSRAKQASLGGVGAHHVLRTADDSVPLSDIEGGPAISPTPSPEPRDNPFATPGPSMVSLHDTQQSAIMTASTSVSSFEELSPTTPTIERPVLGASSSFSKQPPTAPQPLDLPKPRTPPPSSESPHSSRPPEPVSPPVVAPPQPEEEPEPTRWWTEWLCGCSEGGDHQAARTNPFE